MDVTHPMCNKKTVSNRKLRRIKKNHTTQNANRIEIVTTYIEDNLNPILFSFIPLQKEIVLVHLQVCLKILLVKRIYACVFQACLIIPHGFNTMLKKSSFHSKNVESRQRMAQRLKFALLQQTRVVFKCSTSVLSKCVDTTIAAKKSVVALTITYGISELLAKICFDAQNKRRANQRMNIRKICKMTVAK